MNKPSHCYNHSFGLPMLTCITRSMNNELYEKMLSLCPREWTFIKIENSTAAGYLDYLFTTKFDTKWILNLDEDCFLIDYNLVYKLVEFMESNEYDYCGVQDGGSISVRIHNPLVSNPFFNLFNNSKIFQLEKNYAEKKYDVTEIKEKYNHLIRFLNKRYKFDFYEQFYTHFFWLLENGLKPYFLDAVDYDKEKYYVIAPLLRIIPYNNSPTMIRSNDGQEMALHTWHSRYMNYPNIRKHIYNCYNYALMGKEINQNHYETINLNK